MSEFEGSYTVMVTPFSEDGSRIDNRSLRRFVDWQIDQGVPGLIPLGSTGEFLSVTDDERTEIIETVVAQAAGRIPVIAGTADEWTDRAVSHSREAERLGAAGVMVVPPYYSSPTDDELFEHYRKIAESISIPLMIYNNPNTANVDLKPALVARMSRIDNVRYIKESSGDLSRIDEIQRRSDGRMIVFAGYNAYESVRLGARGYVSVCGNIVPRLSADLYELTANQDTVKDGQVVHHRLLSLLHAISGDLYVSATKAAMGLVGMPVGTPRAPRLPLPAPQVAAMRQVLSDLGVLTEQAA